MLVAYAISCHIDIMLSFIDAATELLPPLTLSHYIAFITLRYRALLIDTPLIIFWDAIIMIIIADAISYIDTTLRH